MNVNVSVQDYLKKFCTYPDFPNFGVEFIDIFPLIRQQGLSAFQDFINEHVSSNEIVILPEARGFIFAPLFNLQNVLFLRKEYKRPGDVIKIKAKKEYGENTFVFLKEDIEQILASGNFSNLGTPIRMVFCDDILATGKTAKGMVDFFNSYVGPNGESFQVAQVLSYITIKSVFDPQMILSSDDRVDIHSFIEY